MARTRNIDAPIVLKLAKLPGGQVPANRPKVKGAGGHEHDDQREQLEHLPGHKNGMEEGKMSMKYGEIYLPASGWFYGHLITKSKRDMHLSMSSFVCCW